VWELTEKLGQGQAEVAVAHAEAAELRKALEAAIAQHHLAMQAQAAELSAARLQADELTEEAAAAGEEVVALQVSGGVQALYAVLSEGKVML
jgi:hypothetical protein